MYIKNIDTHAVIKWRLSDICNFKCPYCIRKPLVEEKIKVHEDQRDCINAIPFIIKIAEKLHTNTNLPIKVDLIGGEVTVLPKLKDIVDSLLGSDAIDKINITSNMEKVDVLKSIASDRVTITCSYHPTQTTYSIDEWFEKAKELKPLFRYFKVETVAVDGATHIDEFIEKAKSCNLEYQVEEDLFNKNKTGKACSSTKSNNRYEVQDDTGEVRHFKTRNEFLKKHGVNGSSIATSGILCSRDYDYVYIEQDELYPCFDKPIKLTDRLIHALPTDYHPCFRGPGKHCTLCGNISVRSAPIFVFD